MLRVLSASADWEIVDDDGFIYMRRKRITQVETSVGMQKTTGIIGEPSVRFQSFEHYRNSVLPAFEESQQKKKEALVSIRSIYAAELQQWEELLLKKRQEVGILHCESNEPASAAVTDFSATSLGDPYQEALTELSSQVEELELFIKECTYICDRADSIVRFLDKDIKKAEEQLHLPLFISPRQIFDNVLSP